MSKPPRRSLADILPMKGEAARPEMLPALDQPEALPAEPRGKTARVVRIPLTVKVSEPVYKRLREASFREEMDKQDLVDEALDALLTKMGY